MPNFRAYLASLDPTKPLQIGRRMIYTLDNSQIYASGGSGITLSRTALRWLGGNATADPKIWPGPDNGVCTSLAYMYI